MSGFYQIPNLFIQENLSFLPAFLRGLEHFHYANIDEPINDSDFANWKVGLFDSQGNNVQDLGAPTKDIISGDLYRFYFSFTINTSIYGCHYLVVYNQIDETVKYQSNVFNVITPEQVHEYVYIQYRNSTDLDNFGYSNVANYNSFFLDINQVEWDYEYNLKQATAQTSNERRLQMSVKNKIIKLETYLFDEEAMDAMASVSEHDTVLINGISVSIRSGFSPNVQRDMNVHKGIIEFYVDDFGSVNYKG